MIAAIAALCAVLGAAVGAVLNVVIDRVPDKLPLRGERDGESCPPVSWFGLPAQPWLARGGRGPEGEPGLPARWLWVELTTAGLWGLMAARYGDSLTLVPLLVLAASLVAVSVIDLQLLRIPDRVTFPTLAAAALLIGVISIARDENDAALAALVGLAVYFVLLLVPHLVYPKGMGFGDVKLALVMGLYLGWLGWTPDDVVTGPLRLVLYALMLGSLLGAVFGVLVQVVTRHKGAFPFGPALAAACIVVCFYAPDLR